MNALVRWGSSAALVAGLVIGPPAAMAAPIPEGPDAASLPVYSGAPATAEPVGASQPPRHPFMAPNERSNLHDDAYQTDAYRTLGPLGRDVLKQDTFQPNLGECASITFDRQGRLVAVCVSVAGPTLAMFDPATLDVLATYALPPRDPATLNSVFTSFGGGGYFYLDDQDRAVIPTTSHHILVVGETSAPGFALQHDYDVSGVVGSGDSILSALPDWSGRIWFASAKGFVGTVDPGSGAVKSYATNEAIGNSFAVDETGGVYIVSDGALYRFDAAADGTPTVTWRATYANIGIAKPGQTEKGSGTTPTLMGRDYVSITDNADPMDVVVFKRGRTVSGSRLVCTQPVFGKGASDTDQSLIGTDTSMVVENNYGYSGPSATQNGGTTAPGLARVDINADGHGCHTVWTSQERAPSVVPKLSLGTGLVYTYTKDPRPDGADAWYFTTLSFRTGRTLWKRLGGEGLGHNNNYAPVTIGPDSSMYLGVLGGLVMIRDRVRPTLPPGSGPGARRARVSLVLHYRRGRTRGRRRRVCARTSPRALVSGRDRRYVRRVDFSVPVRRRAVTDRRAPFRVVIRRRWLRHNRRYTVRARIRLVGGGRVTLTRSFRNC
jgi:hypothetical protein